MHPTMTKFLAEEHIANLRAEADVVRLSHGIPPRDHQPHDTVVARIAARVRSIGGVEPGRRRPMTMRAVE